MPIVTINYLAVVVATFASMLLGTIWYSKAMFGKQWMQLVGLTQKDVESNRALPMLLMLVASLVASYTMAHFVGFTGAKTLADGARTGAWIGIGFVFTAALGESIFSHRPARLLTINGGYQVVNLMLIGAILAVWR